MKTGIIRRIDDLGRIVIPRNIRDTLGITVGSPFEISLEGNKICFEPYISSNNYTDRIGDIIQKIQEDEDINIEDKTDILKVLGKACSLLTDKEDKRNG